MPMPPTALPDLLQISRNALSQIVGPGDLAVDATAGNGYDSLHLARLVGPKGLVLAFDVQASALAAVAALLHKEGFFSQGGPLAGMCPGATPQAGLPALTAALGPVRCIHSGHERILDALLPCLGQARAGGTLPHWAGVKAVVFNLGFLPGSDKQIHTCADTSLRACRAVLPHLLPGGLLALHCYSGHAGGQAESDSLCQWAEQLPWKEWRVQAICQHNKPKNRECLLLIQKVAGRHLPPHLRFLAPCPHETCAAQPRPPHIPHKEEL